jgi:NADPH:quinone reductase-like Zn-dependent oxidoreductase
MVQAIGADHVIDYTRQDFTKKGQRYDAIFDVGGTHPLRDLRRALTDEGRWLFAGAVTEGGLLGPMVELLKAAVQSPFSKQKVKMVSARATAENLLVMQEYLAAGKVAPAIDRTYPLSETAQAMRYLESGNVGGKVVVTVAD